MHLTFLLEGVEICFFLFQQFINQGTCPIAEFDRNRQNLQFQMLGSTTNRRFLYLFLYAFYVYFSVREITVMNDIDCTKVPNLSYSARRKFRTLDLHPTCEKTLERLHQLVQYQRHKKKKITGRFEQVYLKIRLLEWNRTRLGFISKKISLCISLKTKSVY